MQNALSAFDKDPWDSQMLAPERSFDFEDFENTDSLDFSIRILNIIK